MATFKKNTSGNFDISLWNLAGIAKVVDPTITTADVTVYVDNILVAALSVAPVASPAGTIIVNVQYDAIHVNGGKVAFIFNDVVISGNTWADAQFTFLIDVNNIDTVDAVVDGIQTDLSNATDGLGALKTGINTIPTNPALATDYTVLRAAKLDEITPARLSELDAGTTGKAANQIDLIKSEADKIALVDAGVGIVGSLIEEIENRPIDANTVVPATEAQMNARTILAANYATNAKQDTAQADLNKVTGLDGSIIATSQPNYAPAKAGDSMAVSDKAGFSLSTSGILAIWHQLTSVVATPSSMGKLIKDFLNASISSRASQASLDLKIPANISFTGADVKATLDGEKVNLAAVTHTGAVIPTVSSLTGHTAQSGDTFGQLPTNFADLSITITTGLVTSGTVNDKTGYQLSATGVNDILRTALTEGYASDGVTPTVEQFMFMLWSMLSEFAISGTTITAKKLDGTTTSMTFATDSATDPTSITRTT